MKNERPGRKRIGIIPFILAAVVVLLDVPVLADTGPQPPCGESAFPSYPEVDQPPVVRVWEDAELGRDWSPPACTGWTGSGFTTLVATVGRFRRAGGNEVLLGRVGAISERVGMRYWSTTHKRWQTLITGACALRGPLDDRCRDDFALSDMEGDKPLFFRQADNLFGEVVYRMRIGRPSPDRAVIEAENVDTVRNLLVPLFRPGEIQSIYVLDRESPDVWRYYGLLRTGTGASSLTAGHAPSYINRAVAFYRFLAGIPTDREPPAAP